MAVNSVDELQFYHLYLLRTNRQFTFPMTRIGEVDVRVTNSLEVGLFAHSVLVAV